jgi:hypothetical protein
MAFGILEIQDGAYAPVTIILDKKAANIQSANSNLKHGKGSNSHLVLEPQPSNDPNDPLNWPQWYKELHLWVVVLGTILNGALPVTCAVFNSHYLFSRILGSTFECRFCRNCLGTQ